MLARPGSRRLLAVTLLLFSLVIEVYFSVKLVRMAFNSSDVCKPLAGSLLAFAICKQTIACFIVSIRLCKI